MQELDYIDQAFWTTKNIKTVEIAEKIAKLIAIREDEFEPNTLFGGVNTKNRNQKFKKDNVSQFIEAVISPNVYYLVLDNQKTRNRDFTYVFSISTLNGFYVATFQATHSYFTDEERLRKFLDIGREIEDILSPLYGRVHDVADSNHLIFTVTEEKTFKVMEKIPAAFWGNYFGKHYIDKIGREKLLGFKGYKVEELNNGDIYIQTTPNPLNPSSREDRKAQHKLAKVIGVKRQ